MAGENGGAGFEVVDRRIRGDWNDIRSRLTSPSLATGPVHIDEAFERVDRLAEIWRATGRVEQHGRLERVEIEVSKASETSADLRVLPWREHRSPFSRKRRDWLAEVADHFGGVLAGETVDLTEDVDLTTGVGPAIVDLSTGTITA